MNRFMMIAGYVALAQAFFSTAPAFAFRGDGANIALTRHDNDRKPAARTVRIEGQLSCNQGASNSGAGCELKLLEAGTGRVYNLTEASNAMRLFQDGTRNVAIIGSMANADTIAVKEAETL